MGGGRPLPFEFSHAWRRALASERRFLPGADLALGWRNLQKGEEEPSVFTRAHLAGAAWLSAQIRSLFSRVDTRGGRVFALLSDTMLRNGAGKEAKSGWSRSN